MKNDFKKAITSTQKLKRRDSILASAKQLMEEEKYNEINMNQIAKKAGVAKGTVYLYFQTKQELFLSVMLESFQLWKEKYIMAVQQHGVDGIYESCMNVSDLFRKTIYIITAETENFTKNIGTEKRREFREAIKDIFLEIDKVTEQQIDDFHKGDFLQIMMQITALDIGLYYTKNLNLIIFEMITDGDKLKQEELSEQMYHNFVLDLIEKIKLKNNTSKKGGLRESKGIHAKRK